MDVEPRHFQLVSNGFSIFALSVTVFSLLMTAVLLAWQFGALTITEEGYGVRTATITWPYRSN